jgi:hypothetical protein
MRVATAPGQMHERLWHEGCAQPVLPSELLDHEFEEHVAIGRHERVVIGPVHLELAVCVLVIALIRPPAEPEHRVANRPDQLVVTQQRCLVVARLCLSVITVAHCLPVRAQYKKLGLDAGL